MTGTMDPVAFLLGFTRVLSPPTAPPAPQSVVPMHPTTNLGLDHDRIKAIYGDSRVQATPTKQPEAPSAPPANGGPEPAPPAPANQQAQRVQQIQEAPRVDAVEQAALVDPLMAARMKEIYADRLTLSPPACRPDGWLAADAPMPWSL